jgi:hypothetical protein
MKTMYTKEPDKECYDTGNGYHAKPVSTCDQGGLKKKGWLFSIPVEAKEKKAKDPDALTWKEEAEIFGIELVGEDGKALNHFKVKALIEEAKANEERQDS